MGATWCRYGNTYKTDRDLRVGVLAIGYADGFRRGPNNAGVAIVGGRRCPLLGRVRCVDDPLRNTHPLRSCWRTLMLLCCGLLLRSVLVCCSMEKTVVSLEELPTDRSFVGSEAVLLGRQGDEYISMEELAETYGTNNYEMLCDMLPRANRTQLGVYHA